MYHLLVDLRCTMSSGAMTKGKGKNPGAGGLDKHIKREAHKERQQLQSRSHLGALEKHKDYVRRSKRRHDKAGKLKELKRAVAQRNPDEFDVRMTQRVVDTETGRVKRKSGGKLVKQAKQAESVVRNSSDIAYLEHKAREDRRRASELLNDFGGVTMDSKLDSAVKHTVFVDNEEAARHFDPVKYFNTSRDMLHYGGLRPNLDRLGEITQEATLASSVHAVKSHAQRMKERRLKVQARKAAPTSNDGGDEDDEEEENFDTWAAAGQRRRQEDAVKKMREINQRMRRAATLDSLAKTVKAESESIKKNLGAKKANKFRHDAKVRKR